LQSYRFREKRSTTRSPVTESTWLRSGSEPPIITALAYTWTPPVPDSSVTALPDGQNQLTNLGGVTVTDDANGNVKTGFSNLTYRKGGCSSSRSINPGTGASRRLHTGDGAGRGQHGRERVPSVSA
jgi:hypothetical protein